MKFSIYLNRRVFIMQYIFMYKGILGPMGIRARRTIQSNWSAVLNTLGKHAYSYILKISSPKTESFQIKNLIFFHIAAQNIDSGYSLEPPQQVPTIYVFEQK